MQMGFRRRAWSLAKVEEGITGLETAIVLIAFVVVSSVFAFASLSTGLFSSDQAKETIRAGLSEAQGTLDIQGSAIANSTSTVVSGESVGTGDASTVAFNLANGPVKAGSAAVRVATVTQTEGTDYSISYDADPSVLTFTTAPASSAAIAADYTHYSINTVVFQLANAAGGEAVDLTPGETIVGYQDADNLSGAITTYGLSWLGTNDSDNLLEEEEVAQVSVTVNDFVLTQGEAFTIQVKPQQGAVVNITRNMPSDISDLMTLN